MKTSISSNVISKTRVVVAFLLLASCGNAMAQTKLTLKSATASIHGSSSLHDWESTIGKVEFSGSAQKTGKTLKAITNGKVIIPVESIKSKEGKVMDKKTFEAFKSDKNPNITYTFSNAQVKVDAAQNVAITASGNLCMAGKTLPVSITAKGKMLPNGDLQLSVSYKLKMTDYGMEPPKAVLGTIKVGDEVTVIFNLLLVSSK
jgi:polyisoprenoid-binding protein YceI